MSVTTEGAGYHPGSALLPSISEHRSNVGQDDLL